ncbi:MAG: dihydrolipoyl dehydrogenase, partial [Nitrospira sp.]|nr:dihydrolipoyl dehydrogenase [Nitrospira sp.]
MKIVIIGGGPGGYVAAIRAAQLGAQVTVIEEDKVGGTCLHRGCIPTKSFVAAVQVYEKVQKAGEYGIVLKGEARWDFPKLLERTRSVVDLQHRGIRILFKSWGVELLEGRGRLISPKGAEVALKEGKTMKVEADRIILATGSRPALLPLFPFDGQGVLTSDDALVLDQIPKDLLIVGAGVSGCEFACIFSLLGAKVTMVEVLPRCLSTEDEEISAALEREFKKAGIGLLCNQRIESMQRVQSASGEGEMVARLSNGQEIRAERALITIGRTFNTKDLGLEAVGVNLGSRGQILVNEYMETNVPGVYAIGDVVGPPMLAHKASREGIIAVGHALGTDPQRMDYRIIPSGIFTIPEIGSVGLTEQRALAEGHTLRIGRFHFRGLAKSHVIGEITGMIKVVSDAQNDEILGVHIIGPHATDLIHEAAIAMGLGAKAADIGQIVHAHPTLSEALMEAFEDTH